MNATDRRWSLKSLLALAGLVLAIPAAAGHAFQAADLEEPSPAQGHAGVIAQGVARMPRMPAAWRVVEREAPPAPAEARDDDLGLAFVLADKAAIFLRAGGERYRLAPGEAFLIEDGDEPGVSGLGKRSAGFYSLELVSVAEVDRPASGRLVFRSEGFEVTGRDFDIDLVRDVLARDETAQLKDTEYPVLVLVTVGTLKLEAGDDKPVELAVGEAAAFDGDLRLTSATGSSAFVAVVIGPEVSAVRASRPTPTSPAAATEPPPATEEAPQPTSAPPAPTSTPPGNGPDDDPDGDGLTNADEDLRGTDRQDADSDDDGLTDGFEVFQSGTLPLDADSDDDGLDDGDEVSRGTNPSSQDTDGDAMNDGAEVIAFGTDPTKSDTDGDGFADGNEVSANKDPNDPNSHP
ncbi:MAG: hypothetical protein QOG89_3368 [Thermomicrobiales bacterium]|nr:hypothetical protein [Thermomicrobiales bacterium]